MLDEEIWIDIPGYEGLYEVSTKGRVRTVERTILRSNGRRYYIKQKYLTITYWGYAHVILHKDKKQRCIDVHRLVASAFIPNPENLPLVNHRDEDTYNNNVENLEWCDYRYNNIYNDRSKNIGNKLKGRKPWNSIGIIDTRTGRRYYSKSDCCNDLGISYNKLNRYMNSGIIILDTE